MREKIGEETSEQLDYHPASLFVVEHVRPKYACRRCAGEVVIADMPNQPIDKGLAGPGLLAQVAVSKYGDHRVQGKLCARWGRGPPQPGYRIRLQTTASCIGQELLW
jgi:transposase